MRVPVTDRRRAFGPDDPGREARNPDEALLLRALLERRCGPDLAAEAATMLLDAFGAIGAVLAADAGTIRRHAALPTEAVADLHLLRALAVRLTRIEARRRPLLTSWSTVVAYGDRSGPLRGFGVSRNAPGTVARSGLVHRFASSVQRG